MNLHDRSTRLDRLIALITFEASVRLALAEQAKRARRRTIIVAADGTATLPSDWQACVKPTRRIKPPVATVATVWLEHDLDQPAPLLPVGWEICLPRLAGE